MKRILFLFFACCTLLWSSQALNLDPNSYPANKEGCLSCHQGIEPIKPHNSDMAMQIYAMGSAFGDPNGCVICHGGNPKETKDAKLAHKGVPEGSMLEDFTPTPGALALNDKTCGLCHVEQVSSIPKGLMNTDAGKNKVITFGWGVNNDDFKHRYANHDTNDTDGFEPIYGTDEYKAYVAEIVRTHKDQFPSHLAKLPQTDQKTLKENPNQAVFSYLRNCNACHLASKGKQVRGHYRGLGCSACHSVFGVEGYYEGGDLSIPKDQKGHMLVHTMQSGENSKVKVNGVEYSGIQISTCNACHSSGRRVSLQYQGMFPVDRAGAYVPMQPNGKMQEPNATYLYKHIKADVHFEAGMLCQDCHTSPDMHGNGNIGTVALGEIEIECQDCHGTPTKYPWELALGVSDELIDVKNIKDKSLKDMLLKSRGLADLPLAQTQSFTKIYDKKDGYLLSARGNPLGNVVKDGKKVILHSATGKTLEVPILKDIEKENKWKNPDGRLAMVGAAKHLETMECYACHSTWASSYYGYEYTIDYSKNAMMIDWIDSAEKIAKNGTPSDYDNKSFVMQPGGSYGDYSHARWEYPILGINGEGRITPLVGVIQTVGSVIDQNGELVLLNNVAKDKNSVLSIDMQPLNPHTSTRQARDCNECHQNPQTMGFGMRYGFFDSNPQIDKFMDVKGVDGKPISKHTKVQISGIKNLYNGDFMQILDKNGTQLMRVDTHFEKSSPLTKEQIKSLKRDDYYKKAKDGLKKIDKK